MLASNKCLRSILHEEAIVTVVYEDENKVTGKITRANGAGNNDDTLPLDKVITVEEALVDFRRNMIRFNQVVNHVFRRQLKQNQFDAMVHTAFNSGVQAFTEMTDLINFVEADDNMGVFGELLKRGNKRRRLHECLMYGYGEYDRDNSLIILFRTNPKVPGAPYQWIPNPIGV